MLVEVEVDVKNEKATTKIEHRDECWLISRNHLIEGQTKSIHHVDIIIIENIHLRI
jgi:hypothetical protein